MGAACVVGGIAVNVVARATRKRHRLMEGFARDRGVVVTRQGLFGWQVCTTSDRLPARLQPASADTWDIVVDGVGLAARTTMTIGLEGAVRVTRDIELGDAAFDQRFFVEGSEPDVVRGVLRDKDTRTAVFGLFFAGSVTRCRLEKNGRLSVQVVCDVLDVDEGQRLFAHVRKLAALLDRGSAALPVTAPLPRLAGVGGTSGAPFGIKT